jgi:hypothetical protein
MPSPRFAALGRHADLQETLAQRFRRLRKHLTFLEQAGPLRIERRDGCRSLDHGQGLIHHGLEGRRILGLERYAQPDLGLVGRHLGEVAHQRAPDDITLRVGAGISARWQRAFHLQHATALGDRRAEEAAEEVAAAGQPRCLSARSCSAMEAPRRSSRPSRHSTPSKAYAVPAELNFKCCCIESRKNSASDGGSPSRPILAGSRLVCFPTRVRKLSKAAIARFIASANPASS